MTRRYRALAVLALAAAMAATVARAARVPNPFARAHWLLDYRFGFMKRALQGEVLVTLSRMGVLHLRRDTIFAVAIGVFVTLCAAIAGIAATTLARDRWSVPAFAVFGAFVTSAYVVTIAHLMGYLDHLVALLALAAVWFAMRDRYWAAGVAITAAVLVHETVFLTGVPVLLMAIAVRPAAPRGRTLIAALAPMILPVIAGAAIVISEQDPLHRMALRHELVLRLSAFPWISGDMNIFVPEWLTTRVVDHFREEVHAFPSRITSPGFVLDIVPTMVLLWMLSSAFMRWRRDWMAAAAVAIVLPLSLHMVAFDTAREWTYPLIAGLTCVWVAARSSGGPAAWTPASRIASVTVGALVAVCNVFVMRYPLLDGEVDRFGTGMRLLIYAPAMVLAALFLTITRREDT